MKASDWSLEWFLAGFTLAGILGIAIGVSSQPVGDPFIDSQVYYENQIAIKEALENLERIHVGPERIPCP